MRFFSLYNNLLAVSYTLGYKKICFKEYVIYYNKALYYRC